MEAESQSSGHRRRQALADRPGHALCRLLLGLVLACGLGSLAQAVTDTDGDQVADAADCAPTDPSLAVAHRYYRDVDGDQFGSPFQPVDLCALKPTPGTVVWGNDPNDADARVIPVPIARGKRSLGIARGGQASATSVHLALLLAAETLSVSLDWSRLESAAGVFDGPDFTRLTEAVAAASANGLTLALTINAVNGPEITLPPDLAQGLYAGSQGFDAAPIAQRFAALLDAVQARTGTVGVARLNLASDLDALMALQPNAFFWQGFEGFIDAAVAAGKQRWGPGLRVGASASVGGLTGTLTGGLLQSINAHTDVVNAAYRPRDAGFQAPAPAQLAEALGALTSRYPGKAIAFDALAYPSLPAAGSSTTRQSQFYLAFFDFWDAHADQIEYASLDALVDRSAAQASEEAARAANAVAPAALGAATAYFQSLGLRTDEGDKGAKSAFQTVRTLALARGWAAYARPASRPYHLALGSFPYAQTPGEPVANAVLDAVYAAIAGNADMVLHQFDKGVPWAEALADTLQGPVPYSSNVQAVWQQHASRQPRGMAVAVAANPLGIPRDRLAPYWGVGEGFYLGGDYQPTGTGITADDVERLLPPPFDTLPLDSPQVRTAYLKYLKRLINQFHPDYLITGLEVNLAWSASKPQTFAQYLALQKFVYESLKADPAYAGIKLVVSFASEYFVADEFGSPLLIDTLLDPTLIKSHLDTLDAVLPYTDVVGLSIYPIKTRFLANTIPAYLFESLFGLMRQHTNKPIAVTETGFPSASFDVGVQHFESSPDKQSRFMALLLAEAARAGNIAFVASFSTHDLTPHMDVLRARAAQVPPLENASLVEFYQYFEFNGLYTPAGLAKPVLASFTEALALPLVPYVAKPPAISLASPDAQIEITVDTDADGALQYGVTRAGQVVLAPSRLGVTVDGVDLGSRVLGLASTAPTEVNETYPTVGAHALATNHYTTSTLTLQRAAPGDTALSIEWRVFNDGVAYRYVIPGAQARTVSGEASSWTLPTGSRLWFENSTSNYENEYWNGLAGEVGDEIGPPVTVKLPGARGYLTISEAGNASYSGMTLRATLADRTLRSTFLDDATWEVAGNGTSPWRVAIIAPDLDRLFNTDLVTNLCPPPDASLFPDGGKASWIRPGKALWSWWSDQTSGYFYDVQQHYIDEAAGLGLDYVTVDVWWELGFRTGTSDQFQRLAQLVQYAHADGRHVDLWVWKNWFELLDPAAREEFFTQVKAAGAVGVKIDNVRGEGADSMASRQIREQVLADSARHALMLNFHGMAKPTGSRRSYPNLVGEEAIHGLETTGLAWDRGWTVSPEQNAILAFTRMVLGPADYTPVTFDPRKLGTTTLVHQLATAGVFHSSVMHYADAPEMLKRQPEVLDVLRDTPTEWDETRVLPGSEIGAEVRMARRKGSTWYLFGLNGSSTAPTASKPVDLGFLGDGSYHAVLIGDTSQTALSRTEIPGFTRLTPLEFGLMQGGGFVAIFKPQIASRTFRMGSVSLPPSLDRWADLYAHLASNADLVIQSFQEGVPWVEALHSASIADYGPHLQKRLWELKFLTEAATPNHPLYLMVNPMSVSYDGKAPYWGESNYMALPPPWDTLPFDHPDVKQAYVNYLVALIEFLHPTYLAINVEANIFLAKQPQDWAAFKDFNAYVYAQIKQRYPRLVVFSTIQYEHMLGLHSDSAAFKEKVKSFYPTALSDEVKALFQHSDIVGISTYPYMVVPNPGIVGGDNVVTDTYFDPIFAIADALKLPIAFEQTGYTSQPFQLTPEVLVQGDEVSQEKFVRHLLDLSVKRKAVLFGHFVAIDYGDSYGTSAVAKTWSTAGLYHLDGTPKPVLADWKRFFQLPYSPETLP